MSRIESLPRRDWRETADVQGMTRMLRTSAGTQTLRPIQAAALKEAAECQGLMLIARVGAGKTLVSGLLARVLHAEKPLLIVPGALLRDAERIMGELRLHWQIPRSLQIVSYQLISQPQREGWLERTAPDLIVCDEAHALKDVDNAACAKRIGRYLEGNPRVRFCAMTGTTGPTGDLLEFWHVLIWALRKRAPVPLERRDAKAWSRAIEGTGDSRKLLGARSAGEAARLFHARLSSAPGVIISSDSFDDVPLVLTPRMVDAPEDLREAYRALRNKWEAPDGWCFGDDAFQVAACARQLAMGFFYRMDPRPPEEFIRRRKRWTWACRDLIETGQADSEGVVKLMVRDGRTNEATRKALADWERAEAETPLKHVVDWLSGSAILYAARWLRAGQRRIVWVQHLAFGAALEEATGLPFFSGEDDRDILQEAGTRNVIASIQSCGEGKNLQAFSDALVMCPPANGGAWEQLLGRLHREGQTRPVSFEYYMSCREHVNAITKAIRDAGRANTLLSQKLTKHPTPIMSLQDHPAWFKAQKEQDDDA